MESSFLLASLAAVHGIDIQCPVVLSTTHHRLKNLLLWTCRSSFLKRRLYGTELHVLGRFEHIELKVPPHSYSSGYNIWDKCGMITMGKDGFLLIVDCFFTV